MGMDVYGKNPKSEVGQYFRNNVWWWHPLWDCCEHFFPEITSKVKYAHENSGDGLNGRDARKLGFYLEKVINDGKVEEYINSFNKAKEDAEAEVCAWCDNEHVLLEENSSTTKYVFKAKSCKICNGTGKVPSTLTWYSLDLENVKSFSEFLKECGGFRIC